MFALPRRGQYVWDYFDATRDPVAKERCSIPEGARERLASAGFECAGWTLAILRLNGMELVHEIWSDAPGLLLVELVSFTGRPELVTLFEDGTIFKTAMRPPLLEWILVAPAMRLPRADRYVYEAVHGSFEEVLARHRARVAEMSSPPVRAETPMLTHFATRLRAAELRDSRTYPQIVLSWWGAFALSVGLATPLTLRHLHMVRVLDHRHAMALVLFFTVVTLLMLIPTFTLMKWYVAAKIVRMRPGPPAVPATELVTRAERVGPGRVYRY